MDERQNSLCAIYADLIETQLDSDDPDMDVVRENLGYIRKHCTVAPFAPGETPEHLEEYQFEEGSTATGTVVRDGKPIPRSAAESERE